MYYYYIEMLTSLETHPERKIVQNYTSLRLGNLVSNRQNIKKTKSDDCLPSVNVIIQTHVIYILVIKFVVVFWNLQLLCTFFTDINFLHSIYMKHSHVYHCIMGKHVLGYITYNIHYLIQRQG